MTDMADNRRRSELMAGIRGRDTVLEVALLRLMKRRIRQLLLQTPIAKLPCGLALLLHLGCSTPMQSVGMHKRIAGVRPSPTSTERARQTRGNR